METLKEILNTIIKVCNEDLDNDKKHQLLALLWTRYYKLSEKLNINLDEAYNLYLILENESYIIYQEPERKQIDKEKLQQTLRHYEEIKNNNYDDGLNIEEITILLNYSVENARRSFESLGINVKTNSLNGLCELGQALSIMPLENLGLEVTKNTATTSFNYPFNHAFGTVTFPFKDHDQIVNKTYLIDVTYRQFFSTVRCNEGRYYKEEENTNLKVAPDPGYFITDIDFAKTLMKDGYIELTKENAKKYGEAFYKASIPLKELDKIDLKKDVNYYEKILFSDLDYTIRKSELEGLNLYFPNCDNKNKYVF